ncbi:MAG: ribonuclease Z [Conexivisphaerales archaeon]
MLGSSAATPTRERGLPAVALERNGELILFDCGEGTQRQMMLSRLSRLDPSKILITHQHGDHVLGLFGLLLSMAMHDRKSPLHIVAPNSVKDLLECVMKKTEAKIPYDIIFTKVSEGTVIKGRDYKIRAKKAEHHGEAYCYRLDENMRPGVFYPEKARALGIPEGPLWHRLQVGKKIKHNGKVVLPSEVTGPKRRGRSFGYSGDTRVTAKLVNFFKGVDLLVFDSTYTEQFKKEAMLYGHSTASQAAKLAMKAGVKKLILTHVSARVSDEEHLLNEAKEFHQNVYAAKDFDSFDIPFPE